MALAPAAMLAWASAAWAAPPPDEVCLAGKEVAAGEYAECRLRAEATFVLNDRVEDYEKAIAECNERLVEKFALLEAQALPGSCPTTGDAAAMIDLITGDVNAIVLALAGGPMAAVCGNGVLEPGEECEWGVMGVDPETGGPASCHSVTGGWLPKGDLACSPGTCTFETGDCFDGCAGLMMDGRCWILGDEHEPCTCVCGDHWAVYDEETAMAGSAGENEACAAILDALGAGVPGSPVWDVTIPDQGTEVDYGMGCVYHPAENTRYRVVSPATTGPATAFEQFDIMRVCACHLISE